MIRHPNYDHSILGRTSATAFTVPWPNGLGLPSSSSSAAVEISRSPRPRANLAQLKLRTGAGALPLCSASMYPAVAPADS